MDAAGLRPAAFGLEKRKGGSNFPQETEPPVCLWPLGR
jgi:hypothetical protein